jgi:enterochelin esterase family protein
MANSLKMMDYDFRFHWGNAQHNTAHGTAESPEALAWLWRGYDPAKTQETYIGDPAEKDKPYWRVRTLNRE